MRIKIISEFFFAEIIQCPVNILIMESFFFFPQIVFEGFFNVLLLRSFINYDIVLRISLILENRSFKTVVEFIGYMN